MDGTGKPGEPPGQNDQTADKLPHATTQDYDVEDGDVATSKRDRYGDDNSRYKDLIRPTPAANRCRFDEGRADGRGFVISGCDRLALASPNKA